MSVEITSEQVDKVLSWAKGAADTIAQEGQIIAEQIIQWRVVELTIGLVLGCCYLLFWGFLSIWALKCIIKAYRNQDEHGKWGWSQKFKDTTDSSDGLAYGVPWGGAIISTIAILMVLTIKVIPTVMALIKINVAPRIYLLEYFKELAS